LVAAKTAPEIALIQIVKDPLQIKILSFMAKIQMPLHRQSEMR
jgi:hypothetical protein